MRGFGYNGAIRMEARTRALTRSMLGDAGELAGLDSGGEDEVFVVAPWDLDKLPWNVKKIRVELPCGLSLSNY